MAPGGGPAREKWSLTQQALDALLASLASDREAAGARYLEIRRNLVRLFEWRGCPAPDEYADEALNRCARKMHSGEEILDVATYAVGVARMLLREMARDRAHRSCSIEDAPEIASVPPLSGSSSEEREQCLQKCLAQLSAENRTLILRYYQGDKSEKIRNRQSLTQQLGVPAGALRMRALRVREALQSCTSNCLERTGEGRA